MSKLLPPHDEPALASSWPAAVLRRPGRRGNRDGLAGYQPTSAARRLRAASGVAALAPAAHGAAAGEQHARDGPRGARADPPGETICGQSETMPAISGPAPRAVDVQTTRAREWCPPSPNLPSDRRGRGP